jgi:hypothetical protein
MTSWATLHLVKTLWAASATVGARQPTLRVLDADSNRVYASGTSATITANQTIDVTWTATSLIWCLAQLRPMVEGLALEQMELRLKQLADHARVNGYGDEGSTRPIGIPHLSNNCGVD